MSCFLVFKTRRHLSHVLTLIQSQEGVSESCSLVFARRRCFTLFSCLYNEKAPYRFRSLVFTNDQLHLVMMFFTITRRRLVAFSFHYNNGVAPTLVPQCVFVVVFLVVFRCLFCVSFFFFFLVFFSSPHFFVCSSSCNSKPIVMIIRPRSALKKKNVLVVAAVCKSVNQFFCVSHNFRKTCDNLVLHTHRQRERESFW